MKRVKRLVLGKILLILLAASPTLVLARIDEGGGAPNAGNSTAGNCSGIQTVFGCVSKDQSGLNQFIGQAFVWVAGIIGTLSMLGLIYAGYTYITSAGNPDSISKAKDIVWTSIAALLIIIFSWSLFNLLGLAK